MRKFFDRRNRLFYFDLLVLFFFTLCGKALPGEAAFNEVHEHHSDLF